MQKSTSAKRVLKQHKPSLIVIKPTTLLQQPCLKISLKTTLFIFFQANSIYIYLAINHLLLEQKIGF